MDFFSHFANSLFKTCKDADKTDSCEVIDTASDSLQHDNSSSFPVRGSHQNPTQHAGNRQSGNPPLTEQQKRRLETAKAAANREDSDDDASPVYTGPSGAPFMLGGDNVGIPESDPGRIRPKAIKRDIMDQIHIDEHKQEVRRSQIESTSPYASPAGPTNDAGEMLESAKKDSPKSVGYDKKGTLESFDFE